MTPRVLAFCAAALFAVNAHASEPDKRLLDALDAENIKYEVQDNGEISVLIEWTDEKRSQIVRIQSKTFSWQQNEYRDVYSIAFKSDDPQRLQRALANRLLEENNKSVLGFWGTQDDTVFNIVRISAKATPSQLREALFFAAEHADNLEKELLRTDDF
jgi:hypothetical protein